MSQVSEIIVNWNPETSGRVATIQIRSRIVGTSEWTEQAVGLDAGLGEFRFGSNAPATDVEVQARFRMVTGVFSEWSSEHIVTAPVTVAYVDLTGTPSKLEDINPAEGGKLEGIEGGATVGAPEWTQIGGVPVPTVIDAIKDGTGTIRPVRDQIAAGNVILDAKIIEIRTTANDAAAAAAKVRLDLQPSIDSTNAAVIAINTDLSAEVQRAKDAEGTLRTRIDSAQGGADGAFSLIATETTQRKDADSALTQRVETIISAANTDRTAANTAITNEITARTNAIDTVGRRIDSVVSDYQSAVGSTNTRIQTEELARASADEALGRRTTTLESRSGGAGNLLSNTDLSNLSGWIQDYGTAGLSINAAGSNWQLGNIENNISFHDVNPNPTVYSQVTSDGFAVEPGSFIQFYALVSAHRSRGWVTVFFYDANGTIVGYGGEHYSVREGAGGSNILNQDQVGMKFIRVPDSAVRATMALRIYPNIPSNDPYAWFARPFVSVAREGQTDWNAYSPGSAKAVLNSTNAAIRDEATTRASQTLALALRSNTIEAQFRGELGSALNTRIANEEITRATQDDAIANRTTVIESTYNTGSSGISFNDKFANWVDGAKYPRGWVDWTAEGQYTVTRVAGSGGSPYAIRTTNDANASSGFYQSPPCPDGKYVVEVTVKNEGGGMSGSGVTLHGSYNLDFMSDPDINGVVGETAVGVTRTWVKLFDIAGFGAGINLHAMHGWTGFGRAISSHYLVWQKLNLRPASPGDIAGIKNAVDIQYANARITAEETTRSNADGALAGTINTVDANWRGANDVRYNEIISTNTRITNEATASSNRDGALGSRIDSVSATFGQANTDRYNQSIAVDARVTAEAIASANRDGALGSRIDTVSATANGASSSASIALAAAQDAATKLGQARVTLTADAGNGRAQLSLYSDSYGNTGVDIVGNTRFKGMLDIDGAAGSGRMKITNQLIEVYDANNVARIRLGFW